jgi:hypothetical protein
VELVLGKHSPEVPLVNETWVVQDEPTSLIPDEVEELIHSRFAVGQRETWFESSRGRMPTIVTNGNRAMLMLLEGEGDAGQHLISDHETGFAGGYVLNNGQVDVYSNRDTVPLPEATRAAHAILSRSETTNDLNWQIDR